MVFFRELKAADAGTYRCGLQFNRVKNLRGSEYFPYPLFCKAHEASMCVKDGVSLETIRDDRFSFSDEASTRVFTVNITDLREEDSGIYWCGAHVITKVHLNVSKDKDRSKITLKCLVCMMKKVFSFHIKTTEMSWRFRVSV
uniref:Immunoglobulin V-set domain-containing protein n=1 Tax=Sinocyclocheilus anshuiensis TaxID=1608454 RepID=A0A671NPG2_9TELE